MVAASGDPNPLVAGRGVRALRRAGIRVDMGVCAEEARELLAPFLTRTLLGRPYVIAKWAQSLDGKLATPSGDSKWISCEASRRRVHRLRARVDAILVGSGTVLADDPLLTARDVPLRRRAARVVLDTRLRTPTECRLVDTASQVPTWLLTSPAGAMSAKARRLGRKGIELISCRSRRGRLVLPDALSLLAARGVTNLMVEGGSTLLGSLLRAGLIDEAHVYVSSRLIGGDCRYGVLGNAGTREVSDALRPRRSTSHRVGDDVMFRLFWTDPPAA